MVFVFVFDCTRLYAGNGLLKRKDWKEGKEVGLHLYY
jgi:hypothetical protein